MVELYGHQVEIKSRILEAWATGSHATLATMPTGAGKTTVFTSIVHETPGLIVEIAHRQELVSQMSLALAVEGVQHRIIGPKNVQRTIVQLQRERLRGCWIDPNAQVAVAGVDTLRARFDQLAQWGQGVRLWVMDESHHLLRSNKWGRAVELFPNAVGLGVTATAGRADGKGLGVHADGVFDTLIEGPGMRELVDAGYLSDYTIYTPPSDLDLSAVPVGNTGDYSHKQLARAVHRSHLVGDVVKHYLRLAPGKLGITFAVDVESAGELAAQYLTAGVPAAVITAKTGDRERYEVMRRFERRELLQLVNVDILGEGVDVPAVEVVSFARPTKSLNLYIQQFGRALRRSPGKRRAIIIDHVGNVLEHDGPPDVPRVWSLDRRPKRRKGERDPDMIPHRVCPNCSQPYEAYLDCCPHYFGDGTRCAYRYVPARRDGPEFVDGDLVQLDEVTLAAMRARIAHVDEAPSAVRARFAHAGAPPVAAYGAAHSQRCRQDAQRPLRELLGIYGGLLEARGYSTSEAQRRFFHRYRLDVGTAQTLGRKEAQRLTAALLHDIGRGAA